MNVFISSNQIQYLVLAICWASTPAMLEAQDLADTTDQHALVALDTRLRSLKNELTEHRSLLRQASQLHDDVTLADEELTAIRKKLKDRQRLNQTLNEWTKASFVLGDNSSSCAMAIQESGEAWTIKAIAKPPFQQYALAAAIRSGVPCRADADCETVLKQVMRHQPPGISVPFIVRPAQIAINDATSRPFQGVDMRPEPAPTPEPRQSRPPNNRVEIYQLMGLSSNPQEAPLVLGTAFPITEHCLATSGFILNSVKEHPEQVARLILRRASVVEEIPVIDSAIHPRFLDECRKQAGERRSIGASLEHGPGNIERQQLQTRLAALDAALAVFDLGILVVDSPRMPALPVSEGAIAMDEPASLYGWPVIQERRVQPGSHPQETSGQLMAINPQRPLQLVTHLRDGSHWHGAPVIGSDGRVRGICSCPITFCDTPGQQRYHVASITQLAALARSVTP